MEHRSVFLIESMRSSSSSSLTAVPYALISSRPPVSMHRMVSSDGHSSIAPSALSRMSAVPTISSRASELLTMLRICSAESVS